MGEKVDLERKEKFGIILPIVLISYFLILLNNSLIFTSTVKISAELQMNNLMVANQCLCANFWWSFSFFG